MASLIIKIKDKSKKIKVKRERVKNAKVRRIRKPGTE